MLISTKYKFVLLANTKCGSTSLVHSLGQYCQLFSNTDHRLRHTSFQEFNRLVRPFLKAKTGNEANALEVISLFREPLDWMFSWYRFRSRPELSNPDHPNHGEYAGHLSWRGFFDTYVGSDPSDRPRFARLGSQADFVTDENGQSITLFRYDDFGSLIKHLEQKIGQKLDILNWNISPNLDWAPGDNFREKARKYLPQDYQIYDRIKDGGTMFPIHALPNDNKSAIGPPE